MRAVTKSVVLAAATLSLCIGHARAASKPLMVFVPNGAADFWDAAITGMKKAQAELPNYKLELEFPSEPTAASQEQLLDDLVAAGAKAIIVSAINPATSTAQLDKIGSQVALFTTDSDAPHSNRIAYIGSSNTMAGQQAAEIAKKAMPHGGKCMAFVGQPGATSAEQRIDAFRSSLAGTGITLVGVRSDGMDEARAKANVSDVLVADPSINCLVGIYSYNTPQIYAALKAANELGKITVVGFDGDPATLGGIKQGVIAGTVVQQPYQWAYRGMKLMAEYMQGNKSWIPANKILIIPTRILTKDNIGAYEEEQHKLGLTG